MKRTLLLALSIALVACGDDDTSRDDDTAPPEKDAAARADATIPGKDAGRDAAPDLLDAAIEAGPADPPDAVVDLPDAIAVTDAASFDAATQDANDASSDAAQCTPAGEDCQEDACCEGTACVTSTEKPYAYCAETCAAATDCESGCCTTLDDSGEAKVCAPAPYCEEDDPTAPLTGINCYNNLNVYDNTGTYMGKATSKFYEEEGVCNSAGEYGKYGSNPNRLWSYSSDAYSSVLAFSAVLGCGDNFPILSYVSKYQGESDKRVIDPDNLCEVLENSNL